MAATKSKHRDEDLFKNSTMTFGEHLDELRKCLVSALFGVALAFILVLAFGWASDIVKYIQVPLKDALERFYRDRAKDQVWDKLQELRDAGIATPNYYDVVHTIVHESRMPTFFLLDVRQPLVEFLQKYESAVEFPNTGLSGFLAADFVDATVFCQQVYASREDEHHVASWIWSKLSDDARTIVEEVAGDNSTEPSVLSEEQKRALAKALDEQILGQEELYDENQAFFDDLATAPLIATQRRTERAERLAEMIEQRKTFPSPHDFNRHLLAMAFPDCLSAGPRVCNTVAVALWQRVKDDPRINPKSLNAQEMFLVFIKAAIVLSLVVSSPWVFYQVWSFVAAGLYPHEKRYVHVFLPFSLGLFLAGVALCFFFVFPYVLDFLFMFNAWMDVDPDMRISEWFGFALFLPLGFGVAFQLPLVMLFLERIGVMTVEGYLSQWRMAILVIFVLSMFLTPADPYSMVLMAIPLVVLYFGGIALCKFMPRGRNPFSEVEEPS